METPTKRSGSPPVSAAKRPKLEDGQSTLLTSLVSWNSNGFKTRCKYNREDVQRLVEETTYPDMIAIQEVKLAYISETRPSVPCGEDLKVVQPILKEVFGDYVPFWSLGKKRYAGTLTLVHNRLGFHHENAAFSSQTAISLLLRYHNVSRQDADLPQPSPQPSKSTASPSQKTRKQTSLTSFFATKATKKVTHRFYAAKQTSMSSYVAPSSTCGRHNEEGRFQFFIFPDVDVLHVYTPNNGLNKDSIAKRKRWDEDMMNFLKARQKILDSAQQANRKLIWLGDMNCALEYYDGTHWEKHTNKQNGSSQIVEWWTDERKSVIDRDKCDPDREQGDLGLPSFTPNERKRLRQMIDEANLLDAWRYLHPHDEMDENNRDWSRPLWTWRGHLSSDQDRQARYEGKGQRIDYFFISPKNEAMDAVQQCEILGYGRERSGLFCGSDHCALLLRLRHGNDSS